MSAGLPQISDEEREQRRAEHDRWLAESRARDEHARREHKRRQEEAAEAARIQDRHRAEVVRAERIKQLQEEMRRHTERQNRDRTLTGLLDHAIEQRQYRIGFAKSAQFAASRQRLSKVLGDVLALKNPPPPPEPQCAGRRRVGGFWQPEFRRCQVGQEAAFVVVTRP
jgi:hypothetical protein